MIDMKILAIEHDVEDVDWANSDDLLKEEAEHVYRLYLSNELREIYFTESRNAVLIMETEDKEKAMSLLATLPLVKAEKIKFEIIELKPYSGYERIMG